MGEAFTASGWKGATYGIRVGGRNRDRYFDSAWETVELQLVGGSAAQRVVVSVSPSFWRNCPELRSTSIGRWFEGLGLLPWQKGQPPSLQVSRLNPGVFRVESP